MKLNYLFLPCVSHFGKESVIWDMWKWSIRLTVIHFRGNQAHYLPNYFLNCTPLSAIIITNQCFSFSCTIGEAIKKPGSRVPYLRGGFTVENLPDGIFFKKPFHYGTKQLQAIMEKKSEIKFVITSNANVNLQSNRDFIPSPTQPETVVTLLSRIVDRQCAERVVRLSDKITEQDVEVVELRLDQEERLRLNEYSFYFEDDAWLAVGANIQHSTEAQGLIVPVFTESEDAGSDIATDWSPMRPKIERWRPEI